ncbi:MAG: hypothetical protein IJQ99_08695 [Synergistaceae bacterium]|nr:hypothetical protein [Synergistaceae bacterium]
MSIIEKILSDKTGFEKFVITTDNGGPSNHPALEITIDPALSNGNALVIMPNGEVYEVTNNQINININDLKKNNSTSQTYARKIASLEQ